MICSDIWHKCHEWYFKIVIYNLRQFWNIASGIYAKYHVQIMLLFVCTTIHKRFVVFTCRYFKLSWNTTALSQSKCRNFSCSSTSIGNSMISGDIWHKYHERYFEIVIRNFTSSGIYAKYHVQIMLLFVNTTNFHM